MRPLRTGRAQPSFHCQGHEGSLPARHERRLPQDSIALLIGFVGHTQLAAPSRPKEAANLRSDFAHASIHPEA